MTVRQERLAQIELLIREKQNSIVHAEKIISDQKIYIHRVSLGIDSLVAERERLTREEKQRLMNQTTK